MADLKVTQLLAYTEVGGDPAAPAIVASQFLAYVEVGPPPRLDVTQILAYVEVGPPPRLDLTQLFVYVEIEYVPPPGNEPNAPGGTKDSGTQRQSSQSAALTGKATTAQRAGKVGSVKQPGSTPASASAEPTLTATLDGSPVTPAALAAAVASDYDGSNANDFTVEIQTAAGVPLLTPNLRLAPVSYSGAVMGASLQAQVTATGPLPELWLTLNWLGYRIVIRNGYGRRVWAGVVEAVNVGWNRVTVGLSLRDMANKIRAQYTRSNGADDAEAPVTDWATDAASVAAFGTKELTLSLNEATPTQAEQQRDTALAQMKDPIPNLATGETETLATLDCVGVWYLLDWTYYANDTGYIKHEADDGIDQAIGYSLTKTTIGFYAQGLHERDAELGTLAAGQWLLVTGSSHSDGAYQVASVASPETAVVVASTDISFVASDDVYVDHGLFATLTAGEFLYVNGSVNNDGYYRLKQVVSAGHLIVTPKTLNTYGTGAAITITQGHHVTVEEWDGGGWDQDLPGATVTLASYAKIAQIVSLGAPGTWDAQEVILQLRITGTPTDKLRVSLFDESAGLPGTEQAYAEVDPDTVTTAFAWQSVMLNVPVGLTYPNNLWLVVARTGAASAVNYWSVAMGKTDAANAKGWDGAAWVAHAGSVSLLHQIWATVDTATAAVSMLYASPFVASVEQKTTTGVKTRLYRDGNKRIREELEALADSGASTDKRLRVYISPDRVGVVEVEQDVTRSWRIDGNGDLRGMPGDGLLGPGVLPLGLWANLTDLPPLNYLPAAIFIAGAEYQVEGNQLTLQPRGQQPWEPTI